MNELELMKNINIILKYYQLGRINNLKKLKNGFSRLVFSIDNKYILKICINHKKEKGIRREIEFYNNNKSNYCPELIAYDSSKELIPFLYTIEKKINGQTLFEVWPNITKKQKEKILFDLVEIFRKLHKQVSSDEYDVSELVSEFNVLCRKCIERNIFSSNEIAYLKELELRMLPFLKNTKVGYIHGDIHFNNIFLTNVGIKLIDFENYGIAPIDKEFDTINRMVRNPNSFLSKSDTNQRQDSQDYIMIMDFLKELYPEICKQENYEDRLLIYDCLNSMKWIYYYPEYKPYNDILFNKSKKLFKQR